MSEYRPDPEALLARVKEEEARARRGKLKGVLRRGSRRRKNVRDAGGRARARALTGVDVVVGYIETHGRAETDALLAGLASSPSSVQGKHFQRSEQMLHASADTDPAVIGQSRGDVHPAKFSDGGLIAVRRCGRWWPCRVSPHNCKEVKG